MNLILNVFIKDIVSSLYQGFNEVVKGFELAEALNAQGFKQPLVDKLRSSDTRTNELASAQSYGGETATIFKAWRGSTVMAAPATFLPGDCSTR